jgi:hypothetical protein
MKSTPVSIFDYNQSPSQISNYELEEDLRTFEEKYSVIENIILGEVSFIFIFNFLFRDALPL